MNIIRINSCYGSIKPERVAFFDVFLNGSQLTFISTSYPDWEWNPSSSGLRLFERENELSWKPVSYTFWETRRDSYEPFRSIHFELATPTPRTELIVKVYGTELRIPNLKNHFYKKYSLTLVTLFKLDYKLYLPSWLQHYCALGVDRFILGFNGEEFLEVETFLKAIPKIDAIVDLVHWPFSYWTDGYKKLPTGEFSWPSDKVRQGASLATWHHAQTAFLNWAFHRFQSNTIFFACFDLDEFLLVDTPNQNLIKLLEGKSGMFFASRWARGEFSENGLLGQIYVNRSTASLHKRLKYIVSSEQILTLGIHGPIGMNPGLRTPTEDSVGLTFAHLVNMHPERLELIDALPKLHQI